MPAFLFYFFIHIGLMKTDKSDELDKIIRGRKTLLFAHDKVVTNPSED